MRQIKAGHPAVLSASPMGTHDEVRACLRLPAMTSTRVSRVDSAVTLPTTNSFRMLSVKQLHAQMIARMDTC